MMIIVALCGFGLLIPLAVAVAIVDSTQEQPAANSLPSAESVGRNVNAPLETSRTERHHRHREDRHAPEAPDARPAESLTS